MDRGLLVQLIAFAVLVTLAAIAFLATRRRARRRAKAGAEVAIDRLASRVCLAIEDDPAIEQPRTQSLVSWYSRLGDDLRRARTRGEYRRVIWSARGAEAADQAWERGQRIPGSGFAEQAILGGFKVAGGVAAVAWAAWREHGDDIRGADGRSRERTGVSR